MDFPGFVLGPYGGHAWGARPRATALAGAASPLPARVVRDRSEGWAPRALDQEGWNSLETENAELRGSVPAPFLIECGVFLEELNLTLRRVLGGAPSKHVFHIRLYADRKEFCRFATCRGAANAESLYDPRTAEMALWWEERVTPEYFARCFAHEFTHAYMDNVWSRTSPLWFAEGMAEYFSNFKWSRGAIVPGLVNCEAVRWTVSEPMTASQVEGLGRDAMYSNDFPRYYAHAWALTHWLVEEMPDVARELLGYGHLDGDLDHGAWASYLDDLRRKAKC